MFNCFDIDRVRSYIYVQYIILLFLSLSHFLPSPFLSLSLFNNTYHTEPAMCVSISFCLACTSSRAPLRLAEGRRVGMSRARGSLSR